MNCECSALDGTDSALECTYPKCPFGEWEEKISINRFNAFESSCHGGVMNTPDAAPPKETLELCKQALASLALRKDEDINEWAEKLARAVVPDVAPPSTNSGEVSNKLVVGINMDAPPTEEMVDAAMYELEGLKPKRHHVRRALEAALTVGATTCRGCGHWSHAMECHTLDCFCADRAALTAQKEG